jgi:hypothetical protein
MLAYAGTYKLLRVITVLGPLHENTDLVRDSAIEHVRFQTSSSIGALTDVGSCCPPARRSIIAETTCEEEREEAEKK